MLKSILLFAKTIKIITIASLIRDVTITGGKTKKAKFCLCSHRCLAKVLKVILLSISTGKFRSSPRYLLCFLFVVTFWPHVKTDS